MELELATLQDISNELGRRSAYGHFLFYDGADYLVGKDLTREDVKQIAKHILAIALYGEWGE